MNSNRESQIKALKKWALDNYENGADTFVECWEDPDFDKLLNEVHGDYDEALGILTQVAAVYRDHQADAAFHRSQAH